MDSSSSMTPTTWLSYAISRTREITSMVVVFFHHSTLPRSESGDTSVLPANEHKNSGLWHTQKVNGRKIYLRTGRSNQLMKPTAPLHNPSSVFATAPCHGLSLS